MWPVVRGLRHWWMILEMSIGNRWPRPGQAAVGALDHVPVGDWPGLAARWLAAGFDSESLRQLAKLRSWETKAALAVMPEALRSTGFDPAPAEEEFTIDLVPEFVRTGRAHEEVSAVAPKPSRCRIAYNRRTRMSSKDIREAVSDRGRGVRSRGERPPTRGARKHRR